jgi:hypothetical protein
LNSKGDIPFIASRSSGVAVTMFNDEGRHADTVPSKARVGVMPAYPATQRQSQATSVAKRDDAGHCDSSSSHGVGLSSPMAQPHSAHKADTSELATRLHRMSPT